MVFACFSWHHLVTGLLLQGVHLDEVWRESQNGMEFVRKVKFRERGRYRPMPTTIYSCGTGRNSCHRWCRR